MIKRSGSDFPHLKVDFPAICYSGYIAHFFSIQYCACTPIFTLLSQSTQLFYVAAPLRCLKPYENDKSAVKEDDQISAEFAVGSPSAAGYSKVLGINLDSNADTFVFDLSNIVELLNHCLPLNDLY